MIKWLAIVFLVVNVVVFWVKEDIDAVTPAPEVPPAQNIQHMVLKSEIGHQANDRRPEMSGVVVEESLLPQAEETPGVIADEVGDNDPDALQTVSEGGGFKPSGMVFDIEQNQVASVPADDAKETDSTASTTLQCYRAAALSRQEADRLKLSLTKEGVEFIEGRDHSGQPGEGQVQAVRVYMGPYASEALVAQQLTVFEAKKIDVYVMESPQGKIIQVGYFSKVGEAMQNAKMHQEKLSAQGIETKLEYRRAAAPTFTVVSYQATTAQGDSVRQRTNLAASRVKVSACP